ncbi:hypothetical protein KL925_003923 [Ogataea polymorpha]|nr:hypothetical protein KL937_002352 [Ogataea polymorpha]KAG7893215.1 hypothetical protein KL908_002948 [Ogataea polymorpha]KAG7900652.1 hypothetical protein KL935_002585 [Ogataea polymorpha]KAG7905035.1 hypothetical protein KL907_003251 [Ogataea polymorpha]KAG7907845.1 hypothetical protein KL906_003262 [Ogataea polymorpha]
MLAQVKERLLLLFRTGKYAQLSPEDLEKVYQVSKTFLRLNESKLDPLEYYTLLELHYFLCLLTTRDTEAKTALDRFSDRFEAKDSEKLVVLKSYYVEILGKKDALDYLEKAAVPLIQTRPSLTAEPVQHHEKDLRQIEKRKVALKSDSPASYIKNLLEYINDTPLDYESWMELAEQYAALGEYEKAYDCVQEVLVGVPAAYVVWCRAGELCRLMFLRDGRGKEVLQQATRSFMRAIELCELHTRSWCGLLAAARDLKDKKLEAIARNRLEQIVEGRTNDTDVGRVREVLALIG